jgi:hypothetical protein
MKFVSQRLEDILASLQSITVDWKDEAAARVIHLLRELPTKESYELQDVQRLLDAGFDDGLLAIRLFLGLSDDQFSATLAAVLGERRIGRRLYEADSQRFLNALRDLGALEAMKAEVHRQLHWSDVLVERLRSGRGSAIAGQRRGRILEDFAEAIVRSVYGDRFEMRCSFAGPQGQKAKCDFAIPSKEAPRVLIESKGYAATGSKMTDIIGDLQKIIAAKRPDTALLFLTDGLPWHQRQSDLRKIVDFQNQGEITRIYTTAMAEQFKADLTQLKGEYSLE